MPLHPIHFTTSYLPDPVNEDSLLSACPRYVDGVHLVYQWIPPQQPQALGLLSGRVDTSHRAAAQAWARHRAIRVTKLEPTLSGDYSCTVSTYEDEDTRTAPLLVWGKSRVCD